MNKNRRDAVLTRPFTENNTKLSYFNLFKMRNIEQFSNNNSGITLIALVVSIVVLLILAGVSINLVSGGDGIISKASKAVDETVKASMKEQIEMYVSEATYDYYLSNPDNKSYLEFMAEYLENNPNMRSNENVDIVIQDDAEVILNYTQGKNVVQMSLSSDGIVDVVGSGTTEGGIEDTYAPKIAYDTSTTSSITVTLKDASGVVAYACLTSSTKPEADSADWVTIAEAQTKQVTITGLTGNQTYHVFAKDKAGNISEGKVCKTVDYIPIEYTAEQNGSNFIVTVTSNVNSIMYQIDNGEEIAYTGAFILPSGSTVYLWNAENRTLTEKSKTVLADVVITYKESTTASTALETLNAKHKEKITLISKPSSLSKEGYEFIGWAESENAEEALDSAYTVPNHNVILYPVWTVLDGALVTPINDVTTWLKMGGILKQYSYTAIEKVIADNSCTESLMNNENAMKYLARSTEFADAICADEDAMTYLGNSQYVDDTVLNSDLWKSSIRASQYWDKVYTTVYTIHAGAYETITIDGVYGSFTTNADGNVTHALPLGELTLYGSISEQSFTRTVTKDTTDVYVMPDGLVIFWYGNKCNYTNWYDNPVIGGWPVGGTYSYTTNSLKMTKYNEKRFYFIIEQDPLDFSKYSTCHIKKKENVMTIVGISQSNTAFLATNQHEFYDKSYEYSLVDADKSGVGFYIGPCTGNEYDYSECTVNINALWFD